MVASNDRKIKSLVEFIMTVQRFAKWKMIIVNVISSNRHTKKNVLNEVHTSA